MLERLEPDIEALLVNRVASSREYFIAPIDACYELVGLIRMHWRGLSGGDAVWREIGCFFSRLQENAKVLEVRLHVYARFTGTIYWDDVSISVIGSLTSAGGSKTEMPVSYELGDNYPNPFNPSTKIQVGIPEAGNATLVIYNTLGQTVRTVMDEYRAAGRFEVTWDGKDDTGRTVGTGVYLYRLVSGQTSLVKKMILVK
jgi:hypothetical protein